MTSFLKVGKQGRQVAVSLGYVQSPRQRTASLSEELQGGKSKRWIRKAAGAQIVSSRLDSGFSAFTLNDMDAFEGFLKWEGHDLTCILMSSIWLPA